MKVLLFSNSGSRECGVLENLFQVSEVSLVQVKERKKLKELLLEKYQKYIGIILDINIKSSEDLFFWKELQGISPLPIFIFDLSKKDIYKDRLHKNALIQLSKPVIDIFSYFSNEEEQKYADYIEITPFLAFDVEKHCIKKYDEVIQLSCIEFKLLYLLVRSKEIESSQKLMDKLELSSLATLYVHIQNIRIKIEENPKKPLILVNCRGKGYKINWM